MALFDTFMSALQTELHTFVTASFKNFKAGAIKHGEQFLSDSTRELQRWADSFSSGQLTEDEFLWLLESKKDALRIVALEKIGLSKVACDRFVNGVIDVVMRTATKTFFP